jgi:hypothetical protein
LRYLDDYDLKEQFSINQEFAFEVGFTNEYGELVYDLETIRPGLAKLVLRSALARLGHQVKAQERVKPNDTNR